MFPINEPFSIIVVGDDAGRSFVDDDDAGRSFVDWVALVKDNAVASLGGGLAPPSGGGGGVMVGNARAITSVTIKRQDKRRTMFGAGKK